MDFFNGLLGWIAALLLSWLIIKWVFKTTFGKAVLAWVPTLASGVVLASLVVAPLMVAILLPSLGRARELAKRTMCSSNLSGLGKCCSIYMAENQEQMPGSLTVLVQKTASDPKLLQCPSSRTDGISYFYLTPPPGADPLSIVACDYADNHPDGRNVLRLDGSIARMTPVLFTDEMAKPYNQRFAAALAEAEAAQPTSRPNLPAAATKPGGG